MAEPFLGQIIYVGFNFAPIGYSTCDGQLLSIAQNTALFSLLGTQFGGNGQTNFALPDLRGRVPIHQGTGAGLSPYVMGEAGGTETVTLLITQLPAHNHTATATGPQAANVKATAQAPANGSFLARGVDSAGTAVPFIYVPAGATPNVTLGGPPTVTIGIQGGSQPHSNMQPYLTINACIASDSSRAIFPSRN